MARTKRRTNKHHVWYPKHRYQSHLERTFRELPCQIIEMDIKAHDLLHRCSPPPRMPEAAEMVEAIRRHQDYECGCYPNVVKLERKRHG